jgi:hypothetical protein
MHGPASDIDPVEKHVSLVGFQQTAGDLEAGGLAGTVGAKQSHDLSTVNVKVDTVHNTTATKRLDKATNLQEWHRPVLLDKQVK